MNKFYIVPKVCLIVILLCNLTSCVQKNKDVEILIENSSDIKKSITIMSYLNNSLIDKRIVQKDTIADRFSKFRIEIPNSIKDLANFNFKVMEGVEEAKCAINLDSITKNTKIHVNYVETLFKKGYLYKSIVLDKDTIVQKEFYCEIFN